MTNNLKSNSDDYENDQQIYDIEVPPEAFFVLTPRGHEVIYLTDETPVFDVDEYGLCCKFSLGQVISDFHVGRMLGSIVKIEIIQMLKDDFEVGSDAVYIFNFNGIGGVGAEKLFLTRKNMISYLENIYLDFISFFSSNRYFDNEYNEMSVKDIRNFIDWFSKVSRSKRYNPKYSNVTRFVEKHSAKRRAFLKKEKFIAG